MALPDIPALFTLGLLGAFAVMAIFLKVSFDYLQKENEQVRIVSMACLRRVEDGVKDVTDNCPNPSGIPDDHLVIVNMKPLDTSLKELDRRIGDYRFWTSYVGNARKKMNSGALWVLMTGGLLAVYTGNADLSSWLLVISVSGWSTALTLSQTAGVLAGLTAIPLIYSIWWTIHHLNRLQDEAHKARTVSTTG